MNPIILYHCPVCPYEVERKALCEEHIKTHGEKLNELCGCEAEKTVKHRMVDHFMKKSISEKLVDQQLKELEENTKLIKVWKEVV